MYAYDNFDKNFVFERVKQFRAQVERRLDGSLTENEFKPLRLMNGLYLQLHAYMLRVAIPYGTLSSAQMRCLAMIAQKWDRGYGHFTTRQNIQYNWLKLKDVPDILEALANIEMHAIQTSGNCIRNVTADHFAGVSADEIEDPRPIAELIRQWSSIHPEFIFLPRKFKVAATGAEHDRAVVKCHDIGLRMINDPVRGKGCEVIVGGGLGRTPMIGKVICPFVPQEELLIYLEALMRVYNLYGRRDNIYKARIKILVHEEGIDNIRTQVEEEYKKIRSDKLAACYAAEVTRVKGFFTPPDYDMSAADEDCSHIEAAAQKSKVFEAWIKHNIYAHKQPGYSIVMVSLKPEGLAPGDATAEQMCVLADIADKYSFGELRVSHEQNIVLPSVRKADTLAVFQMLEQSGLHAPNSGTITDIICCPGLDYCALATARSIPIAQEISKRFQSLTDQNEIGDLKIKISGCINACGHHHVGHIGILGLSKAGIESYQITLGGDGSENAAIGKLLGPGFPKEEIVDAIQRIVNFYLEHKDNASETFLQTYHRVGHLAFKGAVYENC